MSHFKNYQISHDILRALEGLGYTEPTKVQQSVIPLPLNERILSSNHRQEAGKRLRSGFLSVSWRIGMKTSRRRLF